MVLCMSRTRRAFERRAIGHSSEEGYGALHARSKEGRKEGMLSLSQWSVERASDGARCFIADALLGILI